MNVFSALVIEDSRKNPCNAYGVICYVWGFTGGFWTLRAAPPGLNDSCPKQLLATTRLIVMAAGSIALALAAVRLGYDSYKTPLLLGLMAFLMFWFGNGDFDFSDLRDTARLNRNECVRWGMILVLVSCGSAVLTMKLARTVIGRWQH